MDDVLPGLMRVAIWLVVGACGCVATTSGEDDIQRVVAAQEAAQERERQRARDEAASSLTAVVAAKEATASKQRTEQQAFLEKVAARHAKQKTDSSPSHAAAAPLGTDCAVTFNYRRRSTRRRCLAAFLYRQTPI